MTRFEVLKRIEKEEQFADLIVGFVEQYKTPEALAEALKTELTEEGLQALRSTALEGYPLSFSEKEDTLQSIDRTLKRIEKIFLSYSEPSLISMILREVSKGGRDNKLLQKKETSLRANGNAVKEV